ncbi:plant UBX domain-containing 2 [Micractinium conductrix]|uniref:Plant UBX domain-containing 2 n=1 Tax=Micractinium conductrix TaxID=554055 RepID=A0A2P6VHI6_9CHLO|nr:plant UBX domain-containing 2 [Micractinium conductrix]|eukprot:PSC73538.1 plant UBX domain-containing 2 [Micractinium conductrix]
MGYAGYFSTTARIKDKRTPQEEALAAITSADALELLEKVTYNCAVLPGEEKYRKLRLSNNKIKATLVDAEGGMDALLALGWEQGEEGGERIVTLPKGQGTMAQVRAIQEAQQALKKNERAAEVKRVRSTSSLPRTDSELQRQQMEADRAERAARLAEPAKTSVAQPLPGAGARIATAKDAGINTGCDC